jgi:pimeloyl-ACP methyl ester carboxylesterase
MGRAVSILFIILLLNGVSLPAQNTSTGDSAQWGGPENWSALPVAQSGLNTSTYVAVVMGRYEEAGYTRELVRLQWRLADPIDLYVVLPHGKGNPPAILYLYDYRFDTERFRDVDWCTRATKDGIAAVGFTTALSIERFHSRPMKEWFVSELQESLGASAHDVQMVLNYLASRGDIDMHRIGMFGQGSGGAIAVLAAAVDPRIAALDLINPWGDWPDWLKFSRQIPEDERPLYITPEFLRKVGGLDPVAYLATLGKRPVRIQQVMDDPVTPREAADKIAAAVQPPQQLLRFDDATSHAEHWRKSGLTSWLREQLQPHAGADSNSR